MPHLQKHSKYVAYFLKVCDNVHDSNEQCQDERKHLPVLAQGKVIS